MDPIRIGILGAAKIAPKAVILPARNNPEFTVVAVAARDPARAQSFASAHGIPHMAADYAGLIGRADIDLVYNALPPSAHAEWTIKALEAGKAVLCEKPFAMNAEEARVMVAAAERCGKPLIEAFHNRTHRVMRRMIDIVRGGEIGALKTAEAIFDVGIHNTPTELRWLPALGGGALMDLGCYCVHALRSIAGCEPAVVAAHCDVAGGVDETTAADLVFPGGLRASLHASMHPGPFKAMLIVVGETGSLTISNFLAPQNGCDFIVTANGRPRIEPTDGPSTYEAQLAHVGDVLLRGAAPLTGGADAVANMACIDAIYAKAGYER